MKLSTLSISVCFVHVLIDLLFSTVTLQCSYICSASVQCRPHRMSNLDFIIKGALLWNSFFRSILFSNKRVVRKVLVLSHGLKISCQFPLELCWNVFCYSGKPYIQKYCPEFRLLDGNNVQLIFSSAKDFEEIAFLKLGSFKIL